jgi:RNA polymerase sigma-70 factor (ECF subfamily)
MKDKKQDAVLIESFKKGSVLAFEELISKYETRSFNLALRLTKNQEDAEEVLQDVFSTVYKKIGSFEGKSAFSSWLYRIVVNASFMKIRKRNQRPTVAIEDLSPSARQAYVEEDSSLISKSDSFTYRRETREALEGAINKLPAEYRNVFILRDIDGLSNQEVGEILGLTLPAVKSRLHRARLMLRKKLSSYYREYTAELSKSRAEVLGARLVGNAA